MPFADVFSSSQNPALMWMLLLLGLVVSMYFARRPAHSAILSLTRMLQDGMRQAADAFAAAATKAHERNREVLLAAGREAKERIIEREFDRIAAATQRDLSQSPTLHRQLAKAITELEEDHKSSTQVPPEVPGWTNAVKAVAKIDARGDPMVARTLEGIHDSLVKAQNQATKDYRAATETRHQHLRNMVPQWRKVLQTLGDLDGKITGILQRTQVVDRHIDEYEQIIRRTDRAERELSSSSLVQFFVSLFVLTVAVGGAFINFNLIARPMAEMVGGNTFVSGFRVADIAALVIILVEISMGLFLMESLRITRLFPVIGSLSDDVRTKMIWITFGLLSSLAMVEAGLAYMREILLQDQLATSALLRGGADVYQFQYQWITTAAQMGMGFILPYALTFVAIPLETFVHSLRNVLGLTTVGAMHGLATVLRVVGAGSRAVGTLLVDVYDMVIFAPMWLESRFKSTPRGAQTPASGTPMREI